MLVGYVAGEGVEPTVHKENVVVLEKKGSGTDLIVRNLFMTEIIIVLGGSHAAMHLADFQ